MSGVLWVFQMRVRPENIEYHAVLDSPHGDTCLTEIGVQSEYLTTSTYECRKGRISQGIPKKLKVTLVEGRLRIIPLTLRVANDFVEQWHRHSARTSNDGGKFAIGLEHTNELVGVAIVGRPVARLLQRDPGTAELLRLCTSPACPRNGGSKLYARARRIWQLMGGTRLVTYTLQRESGAIMRGVGVVSAVKVGGRQWDSPSRAREHRAIYDEPKFRWDEELTEIEP